MATLNYTLKKQASGYVILGEFYISDIRYRFSTGIQMPKSYWDSKKKQPKSSYPDYKNIRDYLDKIHDHFVHQHASLVSKGVLGIKLAKTLQSDLRSFGKTPKEERPKSIIEIMDDYIEARKSKSSPNTVKVYNTVRRSLNEFLNGRTQYQEVSDLDYDFFEDYHNHLLDSPKMAVDDGQTITDNTIWKRLSNTRAFIGWCKTKKIPVASNFREYPIPKRKANRVYLDEKELQSVETVILETESLNKVRDIFLFSCYTGLRVSDIKALNSSHIRNGKLSIEMKKSEKPVTIPLQPKARAILDKYKHLNPDRCLPVISDQKLNDYIKKVAQLAGITQPVERVRYSGSNQRKDLKSKWEFISIHTGRHTFATIALSRGVKIAVLQQLLGHASITQTMEYAKLVEGTIEDEMKKLSNIF